MVTQQGKPNHQRGQNWGGIRQSQQGHEVLKSILGQRWHRVRDVLEYHVSTSDSAEGQRGGRPDFGLQQVAVEFLRNVHGDESWPGPS